MNEPVKRAMVQDPPVDAAAEEVELNEKQRELLRSLERSFQQAARGETRCVWEFLEELQLEQEAEDNASHNHG